jgi:hypothetical protein
MAGEQTGDPDVQAAALVSEAFSAFKGRTHGLDQATASRQVSAAVKAIQDAPDDMRRRCMLLAAAEPRWYGGTLLSLIGRRPAGLTADDVANLLPALPRLLPWGQQSLAKTGADALLSQAEAIWTGLDDAGMARLRDAILRVAPKVDHVAAAQRLHKLAARDGEVPYALINEVSEVGKALRAAFEAIPEPDEAKAKLITVLAAYPVTGKPRRTWRSDAAAALMDLKEPVAAMSALLEAAISAPDYAHRQRADVFYFATKANEAFLCGTTVLASRAAAGSTQDGGAGLLSRLRQLALKAITIIGGSYGQPRSVRLANHCVQAIADAALPASITELIRTERGTRHGSLLRAVRTAIGALAAAQGLTRDELVEMAVEDHGHTGRGPGLRALVRCRHLQLGAGPPPPSVYSRQLTCRAGSSHATVQRGGQPKWIARQVGCVRQSHPLARPTVTPRTDGRTRRSGRRNHPAVRAAPGRGGPRRDPGDHRGANGTARGRAHPADEDLLCPAV